MTFIAGLADDGGTCRQGSAASWAGWERSSADAGCAESGGTGWIAPLQGHRDRRGAMSTMSAMPPEPGLGPQWVLMTSPPQAYNPPPSQQDMLRRAPT